MEHFKIIMGMIGSVYVLIISVYIFTFKGYKATQASMGKIYETINAHKQCADIHTDKKDFVAADVCNALHGALKEDMVEIKKDVKCILSKV